MNQRELKKLKKLADTLTNEQLEKEYYDTVYKICKVYYCWQKDRNCL
jgi:hypothetical protein